MVCAHTTNGLVGPFTDGCAPESQSAYQFAAYQARTNRNVSWDFTVGTDGLIAWQNDPVSFYTWHATSINPRSIGFEMVQPQNNEIRECQIVAATRLTLFLCAALSIQVQTPVLAGRPDARVIPRIAAGGADVVGIVGHRNVTEERGRGDPGDPFFDAVLAQKAAGFDYRSGEDLAFWRAKQAQLGLPTTGVPLRPEAEALRLRGLPFGMEFGPWRDASGGSPLPWIAAGLAAAAALALVVKARRSGQSPGELARSIAFGLRR